MSSEPGVKFLDNLMINESGIVILLRQVWVYTGKRELRAKNISHTTDIISQISMVEMCKNEF